MPKRKQDVIFLPVFLDKEGKRTFQSYRIEPTEIENEKGEKVKSFKAVANEHAKDKYGEDYFKPMNRRSLRTQEARLKRYERRYGKKPLVLVDDRPFELQSSIFEKNP